MSGSRESGITLLEIMVVIVIILLLSYLAKAPMARFLKTMEQKNAVIGVKKMMQTARSRAMANPSIHCGVYFDMVSIPPKAILFQDTFAPGSYSYDPGKDKSYLAPFELPRGTVLSVPTPYPPAVIYRGDGSAFLSSMLVVRSAVLSDTLEVLASTGRIRSTR
jgi:type II secretory pathway pseudopilin PulG